MDYLLNHSSPYYLHREENQGIVLVSPKLSTIILGAEV